MLPPPPPSATSPGSYGLACMREEWEKRHAHRHVRSRPPRQRRVQPRRVRRRVVLREVRRRLRRRRERAGQIQRDRRDELEDVLRDRPPHARVRAQRRRGVREVHHSVHARLLRDHLLPEPLWRGRRLRRARHPAPVPDAAHVVAWDDLREPPGLDVPDLDEPRVEEEHIGRVPCDVLCCALPLDRPDRPAGISVAVDIQAELCESVLSEAGRRL